MTCNCFKYDKCICVPKQRVKEFKLHYVPSNENCIKFFVNGVMYSSHTGAIRYNKQENCIEWLWNSENFGFDIEPSFTCMAVYNYSEEDNLDKATPIDKIEGVLNSIILADPELIRTNNNNLFLVPYLASQIFRDNLSYKAVVEERFTDLRNDINRSLMNFSDRTIVPINEINKLLLACPQFLRDRTIPPWLDINIVYDYLKSQINAKNINKDDLLVIYAYMWKYITDEVE